MYRGCIKDVSRMCQRKSVVWFGVVWFDFVSFDLIWFGFEKKTIPRRSILAIGNYRPRK